MNLKVFFPDSWILFSLQKNPRLFFMATSAHFSAFFKIYILYLWIHNRCFIFTNWRPKVVLFFFKYDFMLVLCSEQSVLALLGHYFILHIKISRFNIFLTNFFHTRFYFNSCPWTNFNSFIRFLFSSNNNPPFLYSSHHLFRALTSLFSDSLRFLTMSVTTGVSL